MTDMGLIETGVEKVRAFALPMGVWPDGSFVISPRVALVRWRSDWSDKLHQVYVNGRFGGVTCETGQRQMVVAVPSCVDWPVRIEVFAVEPSEADKDFGADVDAGEFSCGGSGRVRIELLRSQDLLQGSIIEIYSDNGTGTVDYSEAVTKAPIKVWSAWQDKAGFGMSCFGQGDFGYDSAAAVGFGKGSFGRGLFGLDADTLDWVSEPLGAGEYRFGIKVTDPAGNTSVQESEAVTVIPPAVPAGEVSVESFDSGNNELVLSLR